MSAQHRLHLKRDRRADKNEPTSLGQYAVACTKRPSPHPHPLPIATKPSFQNALQYATLPEREATTPLHTMAPAFVAELQSMLPTVPLVVVVDGTSKQAVHVVMWEGTVDVYEVGFQAHKEVCKPATALPSSSHFTHARPQNRGRARCPLLVPEGKTKKETRWLPS